jgi:hypothetical protein
MQEVLELRKVLPNGEQHVPQTWVQESATLQFQVTQTLHSISESLEPAEVNIFQRDAFKPHSRYDREEFVKMLIITVSSIALNMQDPQVNCVLQQLGHHAFEARYICDLQIICR